MYYNKQIHYIDYLENGIKQQNAGYVKITVTEGKLLLEMQIRGLHETDDVASEVIIQGAGCESRIGTVLIQQGSGSFRWEFTDEIHTGEDIVLCQGLQYGQMERIEVQLSTRRCLQCIWREILRQEVELPQMDEENIEEVELPQTDEENVEGVELSQADEGESVVEEELPQTDETENVEEEPPAIVTAELEMPKVTENRTVPMGEDKWMQLQNIYPHIRPFRDDREYLSIRPQDFVILREDAYRLVRNSFLLHGFYNYEHLILAKVIQRGENRFYIGVPGNFYEKEKEVAIMFGFESFECKQEPAQVGDFGYYMIRVEL